MRREGGGKEPAAAEGEKEKGHETEKEGALVIATLYADAV